MVCAAFGEPVVSFSWQAQYFVNLCVHFSWHAQRLVNLCCHFSWQAQHLVNLKCPFFALFMACTAFDKPLLSFFVAGATFGDLKCLLLRLRKIWRTFRSSLNLWFLQSRKGKKNVACGYPREGLQDNRAIKAGPANSQKNASFEWVFATFCFCNLSKNETTIRLADQLPTGGP